MNHSIRLGLRLKFLLIINGVLILVFGTVFAVLISSNTKTLRESLENESRTFATLATEPIGKAFVTFKDSGTLRIAEQATAYAELDKSITNIRVVDLDAQTLFSMKKSEKATVVTPADSSAFEAVYKNADDGLLTQVIFPYFEDSGARRYSLVYDVSPESVRAEINQQIVTLVSIGSVSLAVASAVTYWIVLITILRPIKTLSQQATIISIGHFEQEIRLKGNDEIAQLAESVGSMAESMNAVITKLKESDKLKSEFMMISSHNLRTPLMIIDTIIDTLNVTNPTAVEEYQKAIKSIAESTKRLSVLTEDMLTISQVESGSALRVDEQVDVVSIAAGILDGLRLRADQKSVVLTQTIPVGTKLFVKGNRAYVTSAVWNILDNAIKFTQSGGSVSVTLATEADYAVIRVTDTGIGISQPEMSKLFTKFHRGTSTLEYNFEGAGIGLYATKLIIDALGGTITVDSTEGKGTTVTIRFLLTPEAGPARVQEGVTDTTIT